VVATTTGNDAMIFDIDEVDRGIRDVRDYMVGRWARDRRLDGVERIRIDEQEAATGWFEANTDRGRVRVRLVAIRRDRNAVYRFLLVTRTSVLSREREALRRATYSFERLSEAEAAKIKALRLLIVPAQAGDRVAVLSRPLPYGQFNEAWFRVMNDLAPDQPLTPGRLLKVIAS